MKFPKRLDLACSCFYQLPDTATQRDLVWYELEFRKRYGLKFHSRIEHYFFFQFTNPQVRNTFITLLEVTLKEQGVQTERLTVYPSKP